MYRMHRVVIVGVMVTSFLGAMQGPSHQPTKRNILAKLVVTAGLGSVSGIATYLHACAPLIHSIPDVQREGVLVGFGLLTTLCLSCKMLNLLTPSAAVDPSKDCLRPLEADRLLHD